MSVPVVVLNRDHRLDALSLLCCARGAQKCSIGLSKDPKLDSAAVDYFKSITSSRVVSEPTGTECCPIPRRKRMLLTTASNQLACGMATPKRKRWSLASPSLQGRCEGSTTLGKRRKRTWPKMSNRHYCETHASWATRTNKPSSCYNSSDKEANEITAAHESSSIRANISAQDKTSGSTSKLTLTNTANESDSGSAISVTWSSQVSRDGIIQEDFMALLYLCPSLITQRARKCTHARISKYLRIKSHDLWSKMSAERNCLDTSLLPCANTVKRPCYVLLKRSRVIDCLVLQKNPSSVDLRSFMADSKAAHSRKLLIDSHWRRLTGDKLKKAPVLEHIPLQISNAKGPSHSSNHPESIVPRPVVAKDTNRKPLSTLNSTIQASQASGWKEAFVKVERNAGLDKFALRMSNSLSECPSSPWTSARVSFSPCEDKPTTEMSKILGNNMEQADLGKLRIVIYRDISIDKLAFGNVSGNNTSKGCNDFPVPNHLKLPGQATSELPSVSIASILPQTKLQGGSSNGSFTHPCYTFGLLDVIRLKRVSWSDWSVIQPEAPSLETSFLKHPAVQLNGEQCYDTIQDQSSASSAPIPKYTRSRSANFKHTKNSCIGQLISMSGDRPVESFEHENLPHDIHSTLSQRSSTGILISDPDIRSTRQSFSGTMRTGSSISCTGASTKVEKTVPVEKETLPEVQHNENKNPQKRIVPLVKTVIHDEKRSSAIGVVKPLVLRRSRERMSEYHLLDQRKLRTARQKTNNNVLKPSIPYYIPIKKPLGQRSPSSQSA